MVICSQLRIGLCIRVIIPVMPIVTFTAILLVAGTSDFVD